MRSPFVLSLLSLLSQQSLASNATSTASYLRGIDVSHYQGTINWADVAASGVKFACAKATEGTSYVDSQFKANWKGMHSAGLTRCAYHFAQPASNAVAQAKHFVDTVNAAGGFKASKTLQLMLDLEDAQGQTPATVWKWTQAFLAEIKSLTGRPGIIYTGYYFWDSSVGAPADNLDCPLWIASYTSPAPAGIPKAWPEGWAFWQFNDNGAASPGAPAGKIPGISGNVDVDYFKYDAATLEKFCFP